MCINWQVVIDKIQTHTFFDILKVPMVDRAVAMALALAFTSALACAILAFSCSMFLHTKKTGLSRNLHLWPAYTIYGVHHSAQATPVV